jgi:hypothetical protein
MLTLVSLQFCCLQIAVNVLHISKTNIYDGAADAIGALEIMRDTYAGKCMSVQ